MSFHRRSAAFFGRQGRAAAALIGWAGFALLPGCVSPKAHFQAQLQPQNGENRTAALVVSTKNHRPHRIAASNPFERSNVKKPRAYSKSARPAKPSKGKTTLRRARPPRGSTPYRVFGVTYYPLASARGFIKEGLASWYGLKFHGRPTSSGEVYDMHGMTAAHKTLPLGTWVHVTHLDNDREVVVRINDRGPFVGKRIIDLSYAAAKKLNMSQDGLAPVRVVAFQRPEPPPAKKAAGVTQARYAVQIAVFENAKNARQLKRKLENKKIQAYSVTGAREVRVLAGKYSDFNPAHKLKEKIRKMGYSDAFIVVNRFPEQLAP